MTHKNNSILGYRHLNSLPLRTYLQQDTILISQPGGRLAQMKYCDLQPEAGSMKQWQSTPHITQKQTSLLCRQITQASLSPGAPLESKPFQKRTGSEKLHNSRSTRTSQTTEWTAGFKLQFFSLQFAEMHNATN